LWWNQFTKPKRQIHLLAKAFVFAVLRLTDKPIIYRKSDHFELSIREKQYVLAQTCLSIDLFTVKAAKT